MARLIQRFSHRILQGKGWAVLLALSAVPGGALADPVVSGAQVARCLERQIAANAPAAICVQEAYGTCLQDAAEAPAAAVACFLQSKQDWAGLMSEQLTLLQPALGAEAYARLEIETRYDVLTQLVQCDRLHELTLLQQQDADIINVQKARCEATASGLTYMKLLWQSTQVEMTKP